MKLQFKFRAGTGAATRQGIIENATRAGATSVHPLFPDEKDAELSLLYIIVIDEPQYRAAIVAALSAESCVEYVEDEVRRKPRRR